jgi:MoaA/NifB/PqqE/SkfB family radical SAM enzyme
LKLAVLYRGPLSSCNYGCEYCPFAKRVESREELEVDRVAWERFLGWVEDLPAGEDLGVLVTPWGEGLIRPWYQEGLARLSRLPQIARAAIQTNLSGRLEWIDDADPARLALWCTYHPEWTSLDRFLAQCARLDERGVRYSVGIVGFPRYVAAGRALRAALRPDVYMWVNAVKAERYDDATLAAWDAIDPLFRTNLPHHPSRGRACRAGNESISVDGDGTMRRCHFIAEPIGNIYRPDWRDALRPRACSNETCHCHIGYVWLEYLELDKVFGSGILERIPTAKSRTATLPLA